MKNHIHFIGIGGSGISALAAILHKQGKHVTGSDIESSLYSKHLEKEGIKIKYGHNAKNIPGSAKCVIYSLAILNSNIELKEARKRNLQVLSYPEAVGELTKDYYTISVCGTHGKTTITSMLARAMIQNNFDPSVIVGSTLHELGNKNYRAGNSKILILESCEYKRAFLNYHPNVIVMQNIDPDHFDSFSTFDDYKKAFSDFALRLPYDGYFFGNLDDEDVHQIIQSLQHTHFKPYNLFTFSKEYSFCEFYLSGNTIIHQNKPVGDLNLSIPGPHNKINALAAFSVCSILGMAPKRICASLNSFKGAGRRFEVVGKIGSSIIIDDFAHHPTEIKATLLAAKEKYPRKRICVIYQPHQYNRTIHLLKNFGSAFSLAETVIVPNIYASRDSKKDKSQISVDTLVNEIKSNGVNAVNGNGMANTIEYIKKNHKEYGIIFTMGAGDVGKMAKELI